MVKFENCHPKKFHLHTFWVFQDDAYLHVIYLSTKKVPIKNAEDFFHNPEIIAQVEFYTDDTDEARITNISVMNDHRGRGYAYYLLLKMGLTLQREEIETVVLDDDSDAYRKPRNLYRLVGFEYTAPVGPEMFAEVNTLLRASNFEYFFERWGKFYKCG